MSEGTKATEAAERKAQELGVDLTTVTGTGAEGQIKVEDVERAAKSVEGTVEGAEVEGVEESGDERYFEARLNPELGDQMSVRIGEKTYRDGTVISETEYEELKAYKSSPTVEHPSGVMYLRKGPEVTVS